MAKHKQDLLDRVISNLSIRGFLLHPATLFAAATTALIGGAIFLWEGHQQTIVSQGQYRLTEDNIRMTEQPVWAEGNLKKLVVGESGQTQASILDTQLVSRTVGICRSVGYVERVQSIEKSKTGLDIELVYRRPIAAVELSRRTMVRKWPKDKSGQSVLMPIDRLGIVMPESINKHQQLPTIYIKYPKNTEKLDPWTDWQDDRIKDAAAIIAQFEQPLADFGIFFITTDRFLESDKLAATTKPFELGSGRGTRIIWGNAPGKELPNEATVAQKLEAIKSVVSEYGRLDRSNLGNIDVRTGNLSISRASKTASNDDDFFEFQ